jgi:cytosine/adenosine deaminase-related metal-dependent hydrolase
VKTLQSLLLIPLLVSACSSDAIDQSGAESSTAYKAGCKPLAGPSYALHGMTLLPTGPADAYVVVEGEKIVAVAASSSLVPSGVKIIETNGVIAPGLVDLHNHVAYDFIPFWNAGKRFQDRYQWARTTAYGSAVKTPYNAVKNAGHMCEAVKYGELRALVGGTTSVEGSDDLTCTRSWARNIEFSNFCDDYIRENVLPVTAITQTQADTLNAQFTSGATKAYIVHLAEGIDDSSRAEFDYMNQIGLVKSQLVAIHGTALTEAQLQLMGQVGAKLVWSPLSNLALYGQTTNIPAAVAAGITISIAPDWSPSGSANVLGELKVADRVNRERYAGLLSDEDLVDMVTINPARTIAWEDKIGSIAVGRYADLMVVRGDVTAAYRALIDAQPADVLLTTVGGQAFYGASDIVTAIGDGRTYETVDACGESRSLAVQETTLPISGGSETFADIQNAFTSSGVTSTIPLFQCDAAPEFAFH